MTPNNVYKKLQALGYSRFEERNDLMQYGKLVQRTKRGENYKGKSLNHTILVRITLQECNFEEACVTGSVFRSCKFTNCSFVQADFEFCEFYDCEFCTSDTLGASFNNSSFFNTKMRDIKFKSCTFTNTYFQNCLFDNAQIIVSTLEGALIKNSTFLNGDYRNANMDYIEIDMPQMNDVVLPMDTVPFMFGALQYLTRTTDRVYVSKGDSEKVSPYEFFEEMVPLLCAHFKKTEQYFPLANIYFALGDANKAHQAIVDGLVASMGMQDFRMLKYYCKLVAFSGAYQPCMLHSLYNDYICRLFHQNNMDPDAPNYSRYILDIKDILFSAARRPSIQMTMRSNISFEDNHKLGKLLEHIFSLGKMQGNFQGGDIKAVLQENSPLVITISISGEEQPLSSLLCAFLTMTGISIENQGQLPVVSQFDHSLLASAVCGCDLQAMAKTYRSDLIDHSICISMQEYYVDNFHLGTGNSESYYHFNYALKQ